MPKEGTNAVLRPPLRKQCKKQEPETKISPGRLFYLSLSRWPSPWFPLKRTISLPLPELQKPQKWPTARNKDGTLMGETNKKNHTSEIILPHMQQKFKMPPSIIIKC